MQTTLRFAVRNFIRMRFSHHQMLCIQVVCMYFMAAWSTVVAIDCFDCTNATTIEECKSTVTCNTGEICFADYLPTGDQTLYSFGCRPEGTCKTETQSTNEGSGSLGDGSASCSQCCKEHHCNRQLCQESFSESHCSDSKHIGCFILEQLANICLDTPRAMPVCRRFCGLCSYVDGNWATWSAWSNCDVRCGEGHQTRARTCTDPRPSGGGSECQGKPGETQTCTLEPCPVDGHWAAWSTWSKCDVTCGNGHQTRARTCTDPAPSGGGTVCQGSSNETVTCTLEPCKVDGHWAAWSIWSKCNNTCGDGHQTRSRACTDPAPSAGGKECQGNSGDTQTCTLEPCQFDGHWAEWSPWGACSATCGIGRQRRDRACTNPYSARFKDHCIGNAMDDRLCVIEACLVTNGGWGAWSVWTQCSVSCNWGIQQRQRQCNNPKPSADGDYCADSALDVQMCSKEKCPITNGGWGAWTVWTQCSVSCNGGIQQRQRQCNNPKPSADGDYCGDSALDVQMCSIEKCPRWKAAFLANSASRLSSGTLRFSSVILNEGYVYDSSTGVFTCPFPGLYTFTASIIEHGDGNNYIGCYMRKAGTSPVKMCFRQGSIDGKDASDGFGAASGTATLYLVKGDRVYVFCYSYTGASLGLSSFTGFLISEDP